MRKVPVAARDARILIEIRPGFPVTEPVGQLHSLSGILLPEREELEYGSQGKERVKGSRFSNPFVHGTARIERCRCWSKTELHLQRVSVPVLHELVISDDSFANGRPTVGVLPSIQRKAKAFPG